MINLKDELKQDYGTHRSGWSYAVQCLKQIHDERAPELVSFVEKKFIFGKDAGDRLNQFTNLSSPWIGFMHVPVNVPSWFLGHYSPKELLKDSEFLKAMDHCHGLFTLSTPLADWLKDRVDVPVSAVLHPTENVELKFDIDHYFAQKRKTVTQLGWWLRKMHAIELLQLDNSTYKPVVVGLSQPYQKRTLQTEKQVFDYPNFSNNVDFLGFMNDDEYDKLLSNSVVFVDFYDTAANNAIIECIVRAVPILCPPLKAVVDYLGKNYPLYYTNYSEAKRKLDSKELLLEAHQYLLSSGVAEKLTPDSFINAIKTSEVMRNLGNARE